MLLSVSVHFFVLILSGILLLVFLLIVCVILYGIFQYQESVRTSGWSEIINRKISEVIVYDDQDLSSDNEFRRCSERSSFRNLFLQKLVDSEKKFSGAAKSKIKDLFDQHGLYREAAKKLDQKKTFLIAGGIQELTVLDSTDAIPKISRFLSHPSVEVYQEAQYAMVRLKGFEGLDFLDTAKKRISEWQQLRLLLSVTSIPEHSGETIEKWLRNPNVTVVIFTLKLLRKFQLLSFYPAVMALLEHLSSEVRIQAVQTLLSLENPSTTEALMETYPRQPLEVKLEILRTMKVLKDKTVTGLLKKELSENPVSGIKVLAAEALFVLGEQEYLIGLIHHEMASHELVQIVNYALREKLC